MVADTIIEHCEACDKSFPIPQWMLRFVYEKQRATVHTCKNKKCKQAFHLNVTYAAKALGLPVKELEEQKS